MTRVEYPMVLMTTDALAWLKNESGEHHSIMMIDDENSMIYQVVEFQNDEDAIVYKLRFCND